MEELYNNLGRGNKKKAIPQRNASPPIPHVLEKLKKLLTLEDLGEIIDELLELEELPSQKDFFQHLSPLLLRATRENLKSSGSRELLLKGWKEALRVAIEEEVYIWQEKSFSNFKSKEN